MLNASWVYLVLWYEFTLLVVLHHLLEMKIAFLGLYVSPDPLALRLLLLWSHIRFSVSVKITIGLHSRDTFFNSPPRWAPASWATQPVLDTAPRGAGGDKKHSSRNEGCRETPVVVYIMRTVRSWILPGQPSHTVCGLASVLWVTGGFNPQTSQEKVIIPC